MKRDTRTKASGKWRGILNELGFDVSQLNGKHQACPMCGGKDRFRFSDHDGNGSYYCSGCGPGSGFDLLMGVHGWDFYHAAAEVDRIVGSVDIEPFKPKVDIEQRRRSLNKLWAGGDKEKHMLMEYMCSRGLSQCMESPWIEMLADIRYHRGMTLTDSDILHEGMVALVRNKEGLPVSIHRTYFEPKERKVMPPTETITGASIHLGPQNGSAMVVGEGLETTLSGCLKYRACGRASISAVLMESIVLPDTAETVIILADNDRSFTGQKAAFTLARRLDNEGRAVYVTMTKDRDTDFNDDPDLYNKMEWDNVRT